MFMAFGALLKVISVVIAPAPSEPPTTLLFPTPVSLFGIQDSHRQAGDPHQPREGGRAAGVSESDTAGSLIVSRKRDKSDSSGCMGWSASPCSWGWGLPPLIVARIIGGFFQIVLATGENPRSVPAVSATLPCCPAAGPVGCRQSVHLKPVIAMPSMKKRWKIAYTMMIGTVAMKATAIRWP
jgi:hypothetical protein